MTEMASIPRGKIDAWRDRVVGIDGEPSSRLPEFNRALLESMSDGVVACDADGALVFFNRTAREWHSVDPRRLPIDEWPTQFDLYHADGVTPLTPDEVPLARTYRGETVTDAGMAIAARGRPVRFVTVNGSLITDDSGKKLGAVVVMRDVTELRRAKAELEKANQVLETRVAERTAQLAERTAQLEAMDRVNRAIQGTNDLETMMSDVLGVVLEVLDCDRVFLLYPCDPDAASWLVPMERNRPEYPGVRDLKLVLPMGPRMAEKHRVLLQADGLVKFGPGADHPLPTEVAVQFGIKSMMSMALYPRGGKPWEFGVHQCSYAREWTAQEERLLTEVARRLTDGLTSLLVHRDLRKLNRQLRAISNCNQTLLRATDERSLLDKVCRIVTEQMGYRMAGVAYLDEGPASPLRPVASAGVEAGEAGSPWADLEQDGGPTRMAIRTGETITVQDLSRRPELAPWRGDAEDGCRSAIWLPLKDERDAVFGVFLVGSSEINAFSAEEMGLLAELTEDMAFGVQVLRARVRRREAERSVALLSFALNNVRESAFLVDAQGVFRYVNDEACRLYGYSRDELLTRSVADIDPDMPAARWPSHWEELKERRSLVFEGRHKAREGRIFPVEISANYFEYEGQGYNLALAHDVTERRRLEEQLRQSQKMEAVGTLAGGVAHDFNNILTAIIGYANLLQIGMSPEDPSFQPVQEILAASDKAAQLTRGLLTFSRKQVINPKNIDLNDVVRNVEKLLRRLIGEDIELSTTLAPGDLIVLADVGQIEQVLMNLATNARDAMPKGGQLSISTRKRRMDEDFLGAHGSSKPGMYAQITVRDTGVGMDPQTLQKVFEPFYTTKEVGKGTGLGLAIVYGILQQHGGTIDVDSEPGRGTTFEILLPLSAIVAEETAPNVLAPPSRGTETILLAEDDPTVRTLIASILRGHGYHVIQALDGADAIEKWVAHRDAINMLILDVIMPRRSGREVYDAVRAERSDIRVLFLSGYTAEIIHKKGIFDEGLEFLSKPLRPFELLRKVRAILDGKS